MRNGVPPIMSLKTTEAAALRASDRINDNNHYFLCCHAGEASTHTPLAFTAASSPATCC